MAVKDRALKRYQRIFFKTPLHFLKIEIGPTSSILTIAAALDKLTSAMATAIREGRDLPFYPDIMAMIAAEEEEDEGPIPPPTGDTPKSAGKVPKTMSQKAKQALLKETTATEIHDLSVMIEPTDSNPNEQTKGMKKEK